jgi:PhnB protein
MNATPKPVPDGYQSLIPYFTVVNASALLEFVKSAFGAVPGEAMRGPDGSIRHAEARIGNCVLMVGQSTVSRSNMTYMYVPDVDATYRRAMQAPGAAKSLREPTNEWYGDRSAGVEDAWGNQWWFATHVEDVSSEELARRAAAVKR